MKKDYLGLIILGALGIGAYYLFTRSNQADQTGGGSANNQQGTLPLTFPQTITNIYKTFNYTTEVKTQQQTITQTKAATGQDLPKELFRPLGKKTLTGEIARISIQKMGYLPGVLHELYLKETYRKNPGWAIWRTR